MRVHAECGSRSKVDTHLYDLASNLAKIVPQDLGASDAWLLRVRQLRRQSAPDEQRPCRNNPSRSHMAILLSLKHA
jgi:hypothetical protein